MKRLTIDLDFSGGDGSWLTFPPLHLVLPSLVDSFGNLVTLEEEGSAPILPSLIHINERTSTPVETYTVYTSQTDFRFSFYGAFSPKTFTVSLFPSDEARWIQEPAHRFPPTILSRTKLLFVRDFEDLNSLFPSILVDTAVSSSYLNGHSSHSYAPYSQAHTVVGHQVNEIYLIAESFMNFIYPNDLIPHITSYVEQAILHFPNLRTLHLPDPLMLQEGVTETDLFVLLYKNAIKALAHHPQAKIRNLNVLMDQDFWIESTNLCRLVSLEQLAQV